MKHILLLCLVLTCILPAGAQVIKFQSAGGGGVTPSQAGNGTFTHVGAVGNAFVQGSGTNNARAGFFWAHIDWRPAAPSITLDRLTSSNFYVNWVEVSDATGYALDVSKSNTFNSFVEGYDSRNIPTTPPLQFNVSGLESSTEYFVRMRAFNANGESPNSVALSITTIAFQGTQLGVVVTQANEGNNAVFSAILSNGAGARTVKFFSRGIRSTGAYSESAVTTVSNEEYKISIPHSTITDELGLEFIVEATDDSGTTEVTGYFYKPVPANTSIPNLPVGGKVSDYRFISIPYSVSPNNTGIIFSALGAYDKTKWRLLNWNGNTYVDNPGTIVVGQGYWFNAREQHTVTLGEGTVSKNNQATPFILQLKQGWNMVAAPYPFTIHWDDVLEYNANPAVGDYHVFNGTGYAASNSLEAWKGGLVYADNAITLNIPVVFPPSGGRKNLREQFTALPGEGNWLLPLTLKQGTFENTLTGFGMHEDAEENKDRFDAVSLPRFIEYVDLTTTRPESFSPYFMRDVVSPQPQYVWRFTLDASGKEPVTLQWNHESIQQSKAQLLLYDAQAARLVDMRTQGEYTVPNASNRQLQFIFSTDELHGSNSELGKAYPNPFTKEVNLPAYLHTSNGQATVIVNIINPAGIVVYRQIRTTSSKELVQPVWNGTDQSGNRVAPGVYIYKVIFTSNKRSYLHQGKLIKL